MAHGYLGEGYGMHGETEGGRERERGEREWRGRDEDWRERGWRGRDEDWRDRNRERDRGMMFGGGRDWSDEDRARDRDWRREGYGREHGYGGFQGDYRANEPWARDQGGFGGRGDWQEGRRSFSANPDDHYRSWRERHMSELDRDYAEWCREREKQFHQDFESWLTQRHGNPQPLQTGMAQTGMSHEPEQELNLTDPAKAGQAEPDAMDTATLGTTTQGGRKR